jgi:hypothetical protein
MIFKQLEIKDKHNFTHLFNPPDIEKITIKDDSIELDITYGDPNTNATHTFILNPQQFSHHQLVQFLKKLHEIFIM